MEQTDLERIKELKEKLFSLLETKGDNESSRWKISLLLNHLETAILILEGIDIFPQTVE